MKNNISLKRKAKKVQQNTKLSQEMHDRLDNLSEATGINKTSFIRLAINCFIERFEEIFINKDTRNKKPTNDDIKKMIGR